MEYVAALGVLLVWGGILTVGETRWNRDPLLNHPRIAPADKQHALRHRTRSYVYEGARVIGIGVVAGGAAAASTRSAALALAVGAAAQLLRAVQYVVKHQRRGPED